MRTIVNLVRGAVRLDIDLRLIGVLRGSVVVPAGKRFQLFGVVTGNVRVEPGASALIVGLVRGHLSDPGGGATVLGFATRKA